MGDKHSGIGFCWPYWPWFGIIPIHPYPQYHIHVLFLSFINIHQYHGIGLFQTQCHEVTKIGAPTFRIFRFYGFPRDFARNMWQIWRIFHVCWGWIPKNMEH